MSSQKKRPARIEPFRHKVETDPKFFEKSWKKLHDAIREIYNHNASGLSFEELYRLHISSASGPLFFFYSPLRLAHLRFRPYGKKLIEDG
jgi:hypothetical protein